MDKKQEEFGRRFEFDDPAKVYERKEAATCKGCVHEQQYTIAGQRMMLCDKHRPHGKKCKLYKETN